LYEKAGDSLARILVVEDDPNIQALLAQALKAHGFAVTVEQDGARAVEAFARHPFDALVLDVMLPGMNGFQVAEKVRALPSGAVVPIVMTSGIFRGKKHETTASNRFGVVAYVEKPFDIDDVIIPLRTALTAARHSGAAPAPSRVPPLPARVPGEPGAARVALRGHLGERALVWVFAEIVRRRATGVLVLSRDAAFTCVWFAEGAVAGAARRGEAHHLGAFLVRDGILAADDWAEVSRASRRSSRRAADIAIGLGCVTPDELRVVEARRVDAALLDAFGWPEGRFQFVVRDRLPRALPPIEPVAPITLLYRCVREGMSDIEVGREMSPRFDERPALAGAEALRYARAYLPEAEAFVLAQIDGSRTLRELLTERLVADIGPLLLSAMAAGLLLPASALRPAPKAASPAPPAPAPSLDTFRATQPSHPAPSPSHARAQPPTEHRVVPAAPITPAASRDQGAAAGASPRAASAAAVVAAHAASSSADRATRPIPPLTRSVRDGAPAAPANRGPTTLGAALRGAASSGNAVRPTPSTKPPPAPAQPRPAEETSAPPSPSVDSPANAIKAEELRSRFESMDQQDHWGVLGVPRTATAAEVRAEFHKLAKQFHPDRHAYAGPDAREYADRIFARLSEAYRVLSEPELRAKYIEQLKSKPGRTDAAETLARIVGAEKAFRAGEMEMKRRGYGAAIAHFEEAVRLYGEEGEYHAWLAHALSIERPNDLEAKRRVQTELAIAKQRNPNCAKAYLFQGLVHKMAGKIHEAEREFRQALEINDKELDAARELRLISMRKEKEKPKKR
jgi:CheY-like chemotaxis protein/curved DNA-binding protein CbpA